MTYFKSSKTNTQLLKRAARTIKNARRCVAFTGAGISVESGIPPFRGPTGLWSKYDPIVLDIQYFNHHPDEAWAVIKEIFYDFFGQAESNAAHIALAKMEAAGRLSRIITQNIDNLHQAAGSQNVTEYHGTSHRLTCVDCGASVAYTPQIFAQVPPLCNHCGGILKPDFVFFGEGIPAVAHHDSIAETRIADVWLVIGTTGEIYPASLLPIDAKQNGATIIEVNIEPSAYTHQITDIFLQGKATEMMSALWAELQK